MASQSRAPDAPDGSGQAVDAVSQAIGLAHRFAAAATVHDRTGDFPFAHIAALKEAGLLALAARPTAGGAGAGLGVVQAVVGEIARADASTALVLVNHFMVHAAIARRDGWSEPAAARIEQDLPRSGALINALLAEPDIGSLSRGGLPATVARWVDGGWSLSGRKAYATGIPALSWLLVMARTDEPEPRVGGFVVPADAPGIEIIENWDHVGMRATNSHDLVLRDVRIPADAVSQLRRSGQPPDRGSTVMLWNSGLLAALYDGIARAARDWLLTFLNTRVPSNLGAPLASLPRMQEAVGALQVQLGVNEILLRSFARDVDAGAPAEVTVPASNVLKLAVVDTAVDVTTRALDIAANHGLSRRNPLERFHRDALCGRSHAPHGEVLRTGSGRLLLEAEARARASVLAAE